MDTNKDASTTEHRPAAPEKAVWETPKFGVLPISNAESFENFGVDLGSFS